ncbi:MAG: NAD(P)H-dependent oxidoreductase subunit E [Deltaproteobacteria bacterium]|nr:NAD(P)H-dependent oxidoreductase subunit E [Deltaproteobacteria bacterium]
MSSTEFTADRKERFKTIVAKYEQPSCALLPVLYLAQEQWGYLSSSVLEYVAGLLGLPVAHVASTASFYVMLKKKPTGKYWLQLCNNVSCTMLGSEELLAVCKEELGLEPNQTTGDGLFTLSCVQCLGSCGTAPVVQINDDYVENLNPSLFRKLLQRLKVGDESVIGEMTKEMHS